MQVFFDEQIFHKQVRGGISRYICNLALALAKTDAIKVVIFGGWCKNAFLEELPQHPNLQLVYKKRSDNLKINRFVRGISRYWRRQVFRRVILQDPETIYHPTYFEIDDFIHKKAKATVATFYDMIAERFPKDRQKRHRLLKKSAAEKADRIIAISKSTRQDLIQFCPFTKKKIGVVYLGSSLGSQKVYPASDNPFIEKKYFLMIGERKGYKNGLAVLRAFALLARDHTDLHLVLCGGRRAPSIEEQEILRQNALKDRVYYLQANDKMLASLLRHAVALVYPSSYEGFGLPVLEAMQQGCPAITTRLSSLPEVAGDAGIYINPDSPEEIARSMKRLLTQDQERQTFIEKGYQQVNRFSITQMAEETLAIYRELLKGYH